MNFEQRGFLLNLPGFRASDHSATEDGLGLSELIDDVLRAGNFFCSGEAQVRRGHSGREELVWEIYRGRLLGAAQTRVTRTFVAWNMIHAQQGDPASVPLLSVLYDEAMDELHVTRAVH